MLVHALLVAMQHALDRKRIFLMLAASGKAVKGKCSNLLHIRKFEEDSSKAMATERQTNSRRDRFTELQSSAGRGQACYMLIHNQGQPTPNAPMKADMVTS